MKKILITLYLVFSFCIGFSQTDVLLTIDKKNITKEDFLRIYQKNNSNNVSSDIKKAKDYMELFINFKLKVLEAEKMGMDTLSDFKAELENYSAELVKPYLTDDEKYENMLKEAYLRMQTDVEISFIFVEIPLNPTPKDTLEAYSKAMTVRSRLLKGEDFTKVAKETSDATSVEQNGGKIGYLNALKAPYQIENFMYKAKINDISAPFREINGYYIIKVTNIRPNQGEVKVAHIMISLPDGATKDQENAANQKIETIKTKLAEGISFEDIAKEYSDDKSTSTKGGEIRFFGSGEMVPPFEEAAFALKKIGDISAPVRTLYGWHFIKLLDKRLIQTYEELLPTLKTKVTADARYSLCAESIIQKSKTLSNFKEINPITDFYTVIDSTIFKAKWDIKNADKLNKPLFSYDNKTITQQDFAQHLAKNQKTTSAININFYVDNQYKNFIQEKMKEFYIKYLAETNLEYKYILQEYHDGILLFNIQQEKVWNKAVEDTEGLEKYYQDNKHNHMDVERIDAEIYSYTDDKIANKIVKKMKKNPELSGEDICKKMDSTLTKVKFVETKRYAKKDNEIIDKIFTKIENNQITKDPQIILLNDTKNIVKIKEYAEIRPKQLSEIRGLMIAEYQNYLEKLWIEELRKKYEVIINQEVLKTIE